MFRPPEGVFRGLKNRLTSAPESSDAADITFPSEEAKRQRGPVRVHLIERFTPICKLQNRVGKSFYRLNRATGR